MFLTVGCSLKSWRNAAVSGWVCVTKLQTGGVYNNIHLFLTALEAGGPRSKVEVKDQSQQIWRLVRTASWRTDGIFSLCALMAEGEGPCWMAVFPA